MSKVTLEQLASRMAEMTRRRAHYEQKSAGVSVGLKLHEAWRHEYLADPYLLGTPDDRLAARFRDVFINQTELGRNALIGMLPVDTTDFMRKFTHLLEEYQTRGGVPNTVVRDARAPVLRYFENGDPIAVRIFKDIMPPPAPFLVKYGKREFLEDMLREGRMRVCPASYYNDSVHNDAVRDDEISRTFCFSTYRERLAGIGKIDIQGHSIPIDDDDLVLPLVVPDYFLLSVCDDIYYRMPTDFDADAALIIRDPSRFTQRVISALMTKWPNSEPISGPVTYYDPYRDYTKFKIPEMAKHFGYAYQREHRIVLRPRQRITSGLSPEFIEIGSMEDYALLATA